MVKILKTLTQVLELNTIEVKKEGHSQDLSEKVQSAEQQRHHYRATF